MKKRIFLTLALIALTICLFAISVSAATAVDGVYYNFNQEQQTATVAKDNCKEGCKLEVVVIPEKVNYNGTEYTVTAIDNYAFEYNTTIKTLAIMPKLARIPNGMVQGATSLKKLYVDFSNVTEIGSRAVTLATKDDMNPVEGQEFWLYTSESYGTDNEVQIKEVNLSNIVSIGAGAFNNANIEKVTIGSSCTSLSTQIFRFSTLKEIRIDAKVDIPSWFCGHNTALTKVTLANPTAIGGSAFTGCTALSEMRVNMSDVTRIDGSAFIFASKYDSGNTRTQWYDMNGNKFVDLSNVTYIGSRAFGSSNLGSADEIVWPKELKQNDFGNTTDSSCFRNCNIKGTFYLNVADGYSFTLDTWAARGNNFDTIILGNNVSKISGSPWNGSKNVQTIVFLSPDIEMTSSDAFKDMGSNIAFYHNGLTSNTDFSQTNEIKIVSGTVTHYGTCGIVANLVTADGNVTVGETTHNYTLVDYDNTYCPMNSVGNYMCSKCDDKKQEIKEGTNPVKDGHSYATILSVEYENGFLKAGIKTTVCSCQLEKTEEIEAIFSFSGYSIKEEGGAICVGYSINQSALKDYNTVNTPLSFGAVASTKTENILSVDNGVVKGAENTVVAGITGDYASFDFILSGFSAEQNELALVMCAFVYDGESISYMQGEMTELPSTVTLQDVINEQKKEEE
ncbi:MAG: leucine-rich repeat protein [Clostridia bacterium]|nr:leucine-rich repeat protein [Clostridia bacterium]